MKTPEEIEKIRTKLEGQITELDNEEQAWNDLSDQHRLAELLHYEECKREHGDYTDYCQFHLGKWSDPNKDQIFYSDKVKSIQDEIMDELSDSAFLAVCRIARQNYNGR